MRDWWKRIGLQVTGENEMQISAREAVLREFLPDWFETRHARVSVVGVARMIEVSDRQVHCALAGTRSPHVGLTPGQLELETLDDHDAVPHDVWKRITTELRTPDGSAHTDTPGHPVAGD